MQDRKNIKKKVTIGVVLILIGCLAFSWNYFVSKKNSVYEKMAYEVSDLPEYVKTDVDENTVTDEKTTEINLKKNINDSNNLTNFVKYDYVGRLIIPKINFNRGFVAYGSKDNNVDKNIEIMKGSSYPDVVNGNFIIAGHSGTASFSYFKNLYKLKEGNLAYIYYKNVKYTYKIVDIYSVKKTGTVVIKRSVNKSNLTLITCTKNNRKTQTVYMLDQIEKEYY